MILDCMIGTEFGGLEKVFLDQLSVLPERGIAVVGVAKKRTPTATRAHEAGLPCEAVDAISDWDPISLARARAVVRTHSPTLLLCHGRKAHRLFAHAVGRKTPIVAMVHKPKFDLGLPYAGVIVVAEHRRRSLIADGVPPEKIVVVPNAVPLPPASKSSDAITGPAKITGLGRLHEQKGFEVLIEALAILAKRNVDFNCTIAGEGPERGALARDIEKHMLTDRIRLPGWTDKPQEFLMSADIFAFPSLYEDFPLAVLDAMAVGLPIVSSAIDGPKDFLVDGETALLVPLSNPKVFADALERAISDQRLRERLGRNARKLAEERYSFAAMGTRLAAALTNVMNGRAIGDGL